ncbi:MAG: hypothetical protein AB7K09_13310 [Planctomycetota bacterium]
MAPRHCSEPALTGRRNGFRRAPRLARLPWFLRGWTTTVRITLLAALLILLILTIALPAWVLSHAVQAERDADTPGPTAGSSGAMLQTHSGLVLYLPHSDLNELASGWTHWSAPPDRTLLLRTAVRAGELGCPPPGAA